MRKNFYKNKISTSRIFSKNERKLLKLFLLGKLHQIFYELFQNQLSEKKNFLMEEYYTMDSKIIRFLINNLVATGEYTMEGVAYYTRIPFDVIYEAACGITNEFSINFWVKIVDLFMKAHPKIEEILIDKLIEEKTKKSPFSELLKEE